jgi:hypothetical protein
MRAEVPSKGLEWTNLILGAGFACATFAFTGAAAWNAGISGLLIACCSAVALYRYGTWTEWSNAVLGTWVVVSPFALGFAAAPAATWTSVAVGIAVTTIATMQLRAGPRIKTSSRVQSTS